MTEGQQAHLENEILHAAFAAEKEVSACKVRLAVLGQHLESLGRALQEHPEEVTRLPESHSIYDYREQLAVLADGEKIVKLCNELRFLIQKSKAAEGRKGMFISGPFFSREASNR